MDEIEEILEVEVLAKSPMHAARYQVFSWRRLYQQGYLGAPALTRDDG
jgi:hypothetical protein